MTHKMGAKGQVVIPKDLRERAGLAPGAQVEFTWQDGHIVVLPARDPRPLGGRFKGGNMAAGLLEDRAAERR